MKRKAECARQSQKRFVFCRNFNLIRADPFYTNSEKDRELSEVEAGGIGHADELETSQMYHLFPGLCEPSRFTKNIPDHHRFLQHDPLVISDKMITSCDVVTHKESTKVIGIMGDATLETKEKNIK